MYYIVRTKKFEKSLLKISRSGNLKERKEIEKTIDLLKTGKPLPKNLRDHQLSGIFRSYRECHIRGDLLLVYRKVDKELILILINIGSHSYLNL